MKTIDEMCFALVADNWQIGLDIRNGGQKDPVYCSVEQFSKKSVEGIETVIHKKQITMWGATIEEALRKCYNAVFPGEEINANIS